MPSYEAVFVLKKMARPEVVKVLKRSAEHIYGQKGLLFAIENLGSRPLPYAMSAHGKRNREGSYFLMRFDASPNSLLTLKDEYKRDVDIIKAGFVKITQPEQHECTLDAELQPPSYRQDVTEMIEKGRRADKYKFRPKTGLDYNPFRT